MSNDTNSYVAAILSAGQANDVAISPDGSLIYAAGNDGYLRVYNALTGQLEHSWDVGTQLGGIDISPNGTFLMATELTPLATNYVDPWWDNTTTVTTYKVDLSTGAVTSFPITVTGDEYVFNDVAVQADGTVLLTEQILPGWSGWAPTWTLNVNTGTYTASTGTVTEDDVLSPTVDGTHTLNGEVNISDARLDMFQSGVGLVATHQNYQDNVQGFNGGVQAISGEAGLVAQGLGNNVYIYDLNLHYQFNLTSKLPELANDSITGLTFDATGGNLYLLDSAHNKILQVSTFDWTIGQTIDIGAQLPTVDSRFGDSLSISSDWHFFTILAGGNVYEVGNPEQNYRIDGTTGDDSITGTIFADFITGHAGNDTINGLGGPDTIYGGYGDDTYIVNDNTATLIEAADGGTDTIQSSVNFTLGDNFENLTLTGTTAHYGSGNALDNQIVGNDVGDKLVGGDGNDTLTGGTGNDILVGGAGADVLNGGDGNDTLYAGDISSAWQVPVFQNNPDYVPPVLDRGSEVDTLNGGAGVDTIFAGYGDIVDGGADGAHLLISLAGASAGQTVDFRQLDNGGTMTIGGGTIQNITTVDWIEGSNYDDTIIGSDGGGSFGHTMAPIYGLGGNDHIIAGQNTGNIYGGDGNDTIEVHQNYFGGPSSNYVSGDAGDDTIIATYTGASTPSVYLDGGDGNDNIQLDGGTAIGGAGDDVITATATQLAYSTFEYGGDGNDTLTGNAASDTLIGGDGADILNGGDGNDVLISAGSSALTPYNADYSGSFDAGAEHDVLNGGAGNDTIYAGYGDDVDGGTGTNALSLSLLGATAGVTLNVADLETGNAYVLGGGTIQNIEQVTRLYGSNFDDTLTLSSPITVYGMDGNDTINGSSGADQIHGGGGADIINAGGGNDQIFADAPSDLVAGEQINGGDGIDTLSVGSPQDNGSYYSLSGVTLSGVENITTTGIAELGISASQLAGVSTLGGNIYFESAGAISLAGLSAPPPLFLTLNTAGNQLDLSGFTPSSFLFVTGSDSNDTVFGSGAADMIYGNGGDDKLYGGFGNDQLDGGSGNDLLDGGAGNDTMTGGTGDDTYVVDSAFDSIQENYGEGTDTVLSSVTYTLGANLENLTLTGSKAINGFGNSAANVIIGNAANNIIYGGFGNDTLTGGAGNDTFLGTTSSLSGDTITDFSAGDKIVFSNASLASFSFSITGNTLNFSGGSLTLNNVPAGNIIAQTAAGGGVQIVVEEVVPHNDFNGDGRSDVLWRSNDGTLTDWLSNGDGSFTGNHLTLNPGSTWHVAGTGDFNGDGRVDILWQNDDGSVTDWLAQPNGSFAGNHLNLNPGTSWHIVGTGDFNGDHRTDVILQNDSGLVTTWQAQADGSFAGTQLNLNPGSTWHVIGTGDFNGDGHDDVLWQNTSGQITEWLAQAGGSFAGHPLNVTPGSTWHLAGTGDFNGDGRVDLLWRNDDGSVTDWLAQADGTFVGNHLGLNPGTTWHVVGTGDYNADGRTDILWQNDDGSVTDWLAQANGTFTGSHLGLNPGTTWHVQDPLG